MSDPFVNLDRLPPQAIDAEQSVIGCCLIDPSRASIEIARQILAAGQFYRGPHRAIFDAVVTLDEADDAVDILTVANELERAGMLDYAGGRAYLMACVDTVPSVSRCASYCQLVRRAAMLRSLIAAGGQIIGMAHDQERRVEEILAEAASLLFSLEAEGREEPPRPLKEVMPEVDAEIELAVNSGERLQGIPTGFSELDAMLSGLQRGDLVLVAGRPSMGKSALGMNIAVGAAKQGIASLIFSLEMTARALGIRLLSLESSVDSSRLRVGDIRNDSQYGDEYPAVMAGIARLMDLPIWIDERGDRRLHEMRSLGRQWKSQHGIGLVVIDYADLMVREVPAERVRHELGRISGSLKTMAKELMVSVLLLCQLNRESERRANKKPQMSDLAECGYLERDADVILFPFRPSQYASQYEGGSSSSIEDAEIIVAKQRNGPTGSVPVVFVKRFAAFTDSRGSGAWSGPDPGYTPGYTPETT